MASKQKQLFLQGKAKWVHTKRPDRYGKYCCTLYPTGESLEKINELLALGIKNTLRKDEDGYHMTFSRPTEKIDKQGRRFVLAAPDVVDKDGRILDQWVGNGSDVTLKIESYGGKNPMGQSYHAARLAGIRVDNLVEYNPDSYDDEQVHSIGGLEKQPEVKGW